jgi:hypothetical protein
LYPALQVKGTSFLYDNNSLYVNNVADVIPPNEAVPVRCYQQKDGNLLAEFVTRTSGAFKIDVLENMRPIIGSPFQCLSFDPSKVKVLGIQRDRFVANSCEVFKKRAHCWTII